MSFDPILPSRTNYPTYFTGIGRGQPFLQPQQGQPLGSGCRSCPSSKQQYNTANGRMFNSAALQNPQNMAGGINARQIDYDDTFFGLGPINASGVADDDDYDFLDDDALGCGSSEFNAGEGKKRKKKSGVTSGRVGKSRKLNAYFKFKANNKQLEKQILSSLQSGRIKLNGLTKHQRMNQLMGEAYRKANKK